MSRVLRVSGPAGRNREKEGEECEGEGERVGVYVHARESEREGENHLCVLRLYLVWAMQIHELPDVLTFG